MKLHLEMHKSAFHNVIKNDLDVQLNFSTQKTQKLPLTFSVSV